MPGTKISHTPCGSSSRIGWTRPSHRLKSPTTLTRSALGAHTAKCTPAIIPQCIGCAPSFSYARSCVPSLIRCRSKSLRIRPNRYASSISPVRPSFHRTRSRYSTVSGSPVHPGTTPTNRSVPAFLAIGTGPAATGVNRLHLLRVGMEEADDQRRLPVDRRGVGPEQGEGVGARPGVKRRNRVEWAHHRVIS